VPFSSTLADWPGCQYERVSIGPQRIVNLRVASQTEEAVSTIPVADHTIENCVVVTMVRLADTADTVILLDPDRRPRGIMEWHPFPNVPRIAPQGLVKWRAELLPNETTAKCWLNLHYDGTLQVRTYSFSCVLDPETGRISSTSFDKICEVGPRSPAARSRARNPALTCRTGRVRWRGQPNDMCAVGGVIAGVGDVC